MIRIICGNMAGCYSPIGKTFIIEDIDGNAYTGVTVESKTVFDATPEDIKAGKVAASDMGVIVGTHECEQE